MLIATLCAAVGFWVVFFGLHFSDLPKSQFSRLLLLLFSVAMCMLAAYFTADFLHQVTGASYTLLVYAQLLGWLAFLGIGILLRSWRMKHLAKEAENPKARSLLRRVRLVVGFVRLWLSLGARMRVFTRVTVSGRENVPASGRVLICPNHQSISDPLFVFGALRRDVAFLAAAELFKIPVFGRLLRWMGHIPVARGSNAAVEAAKAGELVLEQDGAVGVFPEGGCAPDEYLLPAKHGMAHMAFRTGTPVLPVALIGTEQVKPLKGWLRLMCRVEIHFGRLIHPPYQSDNATAADRQEFSDAVMAEISRLSHRKIREIDK